MVLGGWIGGGASMRTKDERDSVFNVDFVKSS